MKKKKKIDFDSVKRSLSKRYDRIFERILKSIKGSPQHLRLLRIEKRIALKVEKIIKQTSVRMTKIRKESFDSLESAGFFGTRERDSRFEIDRSLDGRGTNSFKKKLQ